MTPQQRIERARVAKGYLEDPVIKEAQAEAKAEIVKRFLEANDFDEQKARVAFAAARAIDVLDEELRRIVQDGVFAANGLK